MFALNVCVNKGQIFFLTAFPLSYSPFYVKLAQLWYAAPLQIVTESLIWTVRFSSEKSHDVVFSRILARVTFTIKRK